jgi:cellulose biosynthesis protein BcsQ
MDATAVTSEKGGVGKSTFVVGFAAELARRGLKVGVVDFDPRATATVWLGIEAPAGENIAAILTDDDCGGAASELAVISPWNDNIQVVPGSRDLASLEAAPPEYGEARLRRALQGWDRDAVLLDTPNRQGGFLIRSALTACDRVLYTTTPDEDGRAGVQWARSNIARFRQLSPLNPGLREAGVVVTRWPDPIPTRDARATLEALVEDNGDLLLRPLVPERVIVKEARAAESWWGMSHKGALVNDAFAALARQIWPGTEQELPR